MERQLIYLAAMLHDIGKFYQRADMSGAGSSTYISKNIKELESSIAPLNRNTGSYSHKHVLWTAQFFEDHTVLLKELLNGTGWSADRLLRTSAAHHNPAKESLFECIIQKADHYSSGLDRDMEGGTGWKDAEEESDRNWDAFKRTLMRSVFEGISLNVKQDKARYEKRLPLCSLSANRSGFPCTPEQAPVPNYTDLWKNFCSDFSKLKTRSLYSFNETVLYLLEKYTSRIPSSTIHLPDVSLFDHLKTTAAFAICLYDYIKASQNPGLPGKTEKPFLLVGGNISGIQKFIYGIVARGAAKNLKGRSFYLQILVDNIVQLILDELKLMAGNVVYSSGGGFYLIAPNTASTTEKIGKIEKMVSEKLFLFHNTDLHLSLGFEAFGEDEIFGQSEESGHIGKIWTGLSEKLAMKKGKKFSSLLIDHYESLFNPVPVSPSLEKDSITGEPISGMIMYLDKEARKQPVSEYTYMQVELGTQLKKTSYCIVSRERLTYFPSGIFHFEPAGLGYHTYFISHEEKDKFRNELSRSADQVRVIQFNNDDFMGTMQSGIDNILGFTWYGGNDYPLNLYEEPKTFEEMTGISLDGPNYKDDSKRASGPGLSRLGILRMDVDNLGAIFRSGMHPEKRSFSRYSTLSRSLDWFFKGYLNTIRESERVFKEFTQVIYAGGDDLFIVGKWDVLTIMAAVIREEFRNWVCNNPCLTISGGMAIVGPRFPILKSAAYSEQFEKAAKKHSFGKKDKDSFCFISYRPAKGTDELLVSLDWETEYKALVQLKEKIKWMTAVSGGIGDGFASDMYNLLIQADMQMLPEGYYYPGNLEVVWLMAYQFKRNSDGKQDDVKAFLKEWGENIMSGRVRGAPELKESKYHPLQWLAFAARWAALEKRSLI